MGPGVGTRSQKPQKRWMGTASDPLARRVETNSTTSGQAQQSAASPQPRSSGPETARLRSAAYSSLTVMSCELLRRVLRRRIARVVG